MTCKYYHCMYAASLCMTMANFHTKSFFLFISTFSRGDKYGPKWCKNLHPEVETLLKSTVRST